MSICQVVIRRVSRGPENVPERSHDEVHDAGQGRRERPARPRLYAAIGQLAQEMAQKGILLDMGGLASSAQGTRIRLAGSRLTTTDGPFTDAKSWWAATRS